MTAAGLAAVLVLGACSSDDSGSGDDAAEDTTATTEATADTTTTTAAPAETFRILVSNDDGHEGVGEGLDALVEGLLTLEDVEVTVSIPLQDRTGSSDMSEPGEQPTSEVTTLSGYAATAVDGYPADAVEQGIAAMAEPPHVVVTGINYGQNIGPLTELSGTVGAARTGARNGIPSLAVSQGIFPNGGPEPDYPSAVELALDWIGEHRDELVAAEPVDGIAEVTNLNVPTCPTGELGDLLEVPVATEAQVAGQDLGAVDCESGPNADVSQDVAGFLAGHPVQSELTA
jgi:5'-nucleotidase